MPFSIGVGQAPAASESIPASTPGQPGGTDSTDAIREPRIRWHYTFFVLAAIGIAAITASLSFNRALTEDFAEAVTSNYEWVEREALYSELVKLSGECAQPGVNFLKSQDADAERARLTTSLARFRDRLDIARREAQLNLPSKKLQDVELHLKRISDGISQTESQVRSILKTDQQAGFDFQVAGPLLVQLNETSNGVGESIVDLYSSIRADQSQRFEAQLTEAEQLRVSQAWFLFGILAMVVVVALYGNRLSRAAHDAISTIAAQTRGLADREARLRTIFNTAAEGIVTINEQGIVESCNQATLDFFQQPVDQIVGTPIHDLFEQEVSADSSRRSSRIRDVDSLVGTRQELIAYRQDGSRMVVDFAAAEVRFDDHRVITGILHDITERKQFVAQLEQARFVAESATRARTQFLANMSHEIRTPMTSILGYAELLSDPKLTTHEQSRCIETIRSNADHLLSLINDILDLSRIEAGQMTIEKTRCCPAQIVNEVVALMRGRAAARELDLSVNFDSPVPEFIHSDPVRLRQILINLIGNAVKFTYEGGVRIHARFDTQNTAGPRIVFRVIDTGIGISPSQQTRLFRPFTQADNSTTRCFGGSGLGLSISKRLVELLGGTVSLSSAEGLGSTFEFDVQTGATDGAMIASPDSIKSVPEPAQPRLADPVSANVLLAEDGEDNRRLFMHHLTRAGVQVSCVENGQKAVHAALAPDASFDLILMDMQMPVMDGYSATDELRNNGYTGRIVALTAHAMSGDRERCLEAGCDDYLTKPVDAEKLIETVRAATNVRPSHARQSSNVEKKDLTAPIFSIYADDEEMAEILTEFVNGLPGKLEALEKASSESDMAQLAARAHDLKGSGGGFGFPAISKAAETVECFARDEESDCEDCAAILSELKIVCERAVAGLSATHTDSSAVDVSVAADQSEESREPGRETPHDVLAQIEELASTDPEWMEVSDVLQNLTTILRQTSAKENERCTDNVDCDVNANESAVG